MNMENPLHWLQGWYLMHCNGDWERAHGVKITTLENPGWRLKIDLIDSVLQDQEFTYTRIDRSEENWLQAWAQDGVFHAAGGATNLEEMINTFRNWFEDSLQNQVNPPKKN